MLKDNTLTYISLFSGAGVGCHGFKKVGFECVATNEIIKRRLNVQRYNHTCIYESGYICGDITSEETKENIFSEIRRWKKLGNDRIDVVIATPPCQGMSVANHKKAEDEIVRNSLVVESIYLIQKIKPRFFIFENVAAFMKTGCTAPDRSIKSIGQVIDEGLGDNYRYVSRILNFKNYGSNSSRTRTVVIGVSKELSDYISPVELYPDYCEEKSLKEVIGGLPELEWGEICESDFYHSFRTYPEEMKSWIHDLCEGESAFDNKEITKRPHQVVDGKIVLNQRKNGDKYTRQYWDRVAPCIHTRNDQLASQNTIHPREDRVFSIRELMEIMTVPTDFRWVDMTQEELNSLPEKEKKDVLKKEEINIRQSIGEAVPTEIFLRIAKKIKAFMMQSYLTNAETMQLINDEELTNVDHLHHFIKCNPLGLCVSSLARIAELANTQRESNAAYYTNKYILDEIYKDLPEIEKDEIHILEPAVGVGNFLPFIFKKYERVKKVDLDVIDIDENNLKILQLLLEKQKVPKNVKINYILGDFLLLDLDKNYDLVLGNPPFSKLKAKDAEKYLLNNVNKETTNTFEFFLEKAVAISDYVALITPKFLLNTPEFAPTRKWLAGKSVFSIQDFGENGFKGVLVETICIFISTNGKPGKTKVTSLSKHKQLLQKQSYIMDEAFPYWLIYRDDFFDAVSARLEFNKFEVFRDRQITNTNTSKTKSENTIRVLKSRNISDDGKEILDIPGYDSYISKDTVERLNAYKFIDDKTVYLTPNMTYKPRVIRNQDKVVVNGSVAVLIPKEELELSEAQLEYFSSDEYRGFYQIARNYQTRSLNVDSTSVFFYGVLKENANG